MMLRSYLVTWSTVGSRKNRAEAGLWEAHQWDRSSDASVTCAALCQKRAGRRSVSGERIIRTSFFGVPKKNRGGAAEKMP